MSKFDRRLPAILALLSFFALGAYSFVDHDARPIFYTVCSGAVGAFIGLTDPRAHQERPYRRGE